MQFHTALILEPLYHLSSSVQTPELRHSLGLVSTLVLYSRRLKSYKTKFSQNIDVFYFQRRLTVYDYVRRLGALAIS